ncbi:unnamed protein product [Mytilus edulis]|uniref:Uncharacterized protein n=1 Tax=Mytilus edulis TaxID=6550 RepID=A0A8S3RYS2_MYTED|nr:unnamed protein product [Mytilus edulis]
MHYFSDYNGLLTNNISMQRYSKCACRPNTYGHRLLELCKKMNIYIANSRIGNDKTVGKITCNDVSVVDYLILSSDLFQMTKNFEVEEFNPILSDVHCNLKFTLESQPYTNINNVKTVEKQNKRIDGRLAALRDYNVKPNTTICMVVCLYIIPEDFNHVVFDLYWGYPWSGKDYLDATCLMFSGTTFTEHAIIITRDHIHLFVTLETEWMILKKQGHHTIDVLLQNIPADITHLFFTLSAWSSPNISKFKKPSLKFFEASSPQKSLCETSFTHAKHSQAVVMCSVSRKDGKWKIFESGKLSSGNAKKYGP